MRVQGSLWLKLFGLGVRAVGLRMMTGLTDEAFSGSGLGVVGAASGKLSANHEGAQGNLWERFKRFRDDRRRVEGPSTGLASD